MKKVIKRLSPNKNAKDFNLKTKKKRIRWKNLDCF